MDISGNKELIERDFVAFFASRNSRPEALDLARSWAYQIAKSEKIVMSGFQSPIERAVLDILLTEGCSVVVALGRALYRKVPPYLRTAFDEGRVLFVSFRGYSRPSFTNSQLRNWATPSLATEIVFAPFDENSQLSTLYFSFSQGSSPCHILPILPDNTAVQSD